MFSTWYYILRAPRKRRRYFAITIPATFCSVLFTWVTCLNSPQPNQRTGTCWVINRTLPHRVLQYHKPPSFCCPLPLPPSRFDLSFHSKEEILCNHHPSHFFLRSFSLGDLPKLAAAKPTHRHLLGNQPYLTSSGTPVSQASFVLLSSALTPF